MTTPDLESFEGKRSLREANSPAIKRMKTRHGTLGQAKQLLVALITMFNPKSMGFEALQFFLELDADDFNKTLRRMLRELRPPEKWLPRDYPSRFNGQVPKQLFPNLKPVQFFDREWVLAYPTEETLEVVSTWLDTFWHKASDSVLYQTLDHGTLRWFVTEARKGRSKIISEWYRKFVVGWKDGVLLGDTVLFPVMDHCVTSTVVQVTWMEKDEILQQIAKNPGQWPIVTMVPITEE